MAKRQKSRPTHAALAEDGTTKFYLAQRMEPEADHVSAITRRGIETEAANFYICHARVCQSFPVVILPLVGDRHALVIAPDPNEGNKLYSWMGAIDGQSLFSDGESANAYAAELAKDGHSYMVVCFAPSPELESPAH